MPIVNTKTPAWAANEGPGENPFQMSGSDLCIPRMKLRAVSLFTKQNCNVLSPRFHINVSVRDLYVPSIDLPVLLQPNRQTDPGNI